MPTELSSSAERLFLDAVNDKETIQAHIADHIQERMPQIAREEIVETVNGNYEKLLKVARVRSHIPTLTEHNAIEEIREHHQA